MEKFSEKGELMNMFKVIKLSGLINEEQIKN